MQQTTLRQELLSGAKDSIPILLGYLAVGFSFGIAAVTNGLSIFQSTLISLSNVTSAGQFAGVQIIAAAGTLAEMILTQLIINLRYALMSLSLTQKLEAGMPIWKKLIIAFANTDEIFAAAIGHQKSLTLPYMLGLQIPSIFGWTMGTFGGAVAGNILPAALVSALSVALYDMFIAIVVPAARKARPVLIVALIAALLSCLIYFVPLFSGVSSGVSIIICTIGAAVLGAIFFPVKEDDAA